ncbi:hypothetical protein Dsin_009483 [Dipteronia sinensis]|uniref:DDE Tnp4 domain-containing protein n=1 Tax=Dipteronia sinensis TaxID=43782 RepID=A0AAE0EBP1_9ROSI|nr:hypothetical protein Dsin_009483 [Dipteronia sinensis]
MEENEEANLNKSNECEDRPKGKKQKIRKLDQTCEEVCKIIKVLEKDGGPSVDDCSRFIQELLAGSSTDVIGAIDGTLVHACIPSDKQVSYRGRGKGECFQNVMTICDFDTIFKYIVIGWEGTTHDSRVLRETIRDSRHNFPMPPPDKYYLVDAAYTHTRGFMAPYRSARYWLNDFRSCGHANTKEEVFNQCHSRLRNIIERVFGVLKACFLILKRMSSYTFDTKRSIVLSYFALHNFLRKTSINDELFSQYDDEEVQLENSTQNQTPSKDNSFRASEQLFMQELREQIANQLFSNIKLVCCLLNIIEEFGNDIKNMKELSKNDIKHLEELSENNIKQKLSDNDISNGAFNSQEEKDCCKQECQITTLDGKKKSMNEIRVSWNNLSREEKLQYTKSKNDVAEKVHVGGTDNDSNIQPFDTRCTPTRFCQMMSIIFRFAKGCGPRFGFWKPTNVKLWISSA